MIEDFGKLVKALSLDASMGSKYASSRYCRILKITETSANTELQAINPSAKLQLFLLLRISLKQTLVAKLWQKQMFTSNL